MWEVGSPALGGRGFVRFGMTAVEGGFHSLSLIFYRGKSASRDSLFLFRHLTLKLSLPPPRPPPQTPHFSSFPFSPSRYPCSLRLLW